MTPLMDDDHFKLGGKRLALNWSVHHPENNLMRTIFEFPYARTVDEFRKAVSHAGAPGLNITWVNKAGDIAWRMMGKYPKLPEVYLIISF